MIGPNDPTAFDQAVQSALTWLNAKRPTGEVLESKQSPGIRFANEMIESLQSIPIDPARTIGDLVFRGEIAVAIQSLLGPVAERMTVKKPESNPFPLGLAVMKASWALEALSTAQPPGTRVLPKEPVANILKQELKGFLAHDWDQQARRDKVDAPHEDKMKAKEEFQAKIIQLRRSA
jgi:hypothetical protein